MLINDKQIKVIFFNRRMICYGGSVTTRSIYSDLTVTIISTKFHSIKARVELLNPTQMLFLSYRSHQRVCEQSCQKTPPEKIPVIEALISVDICKSFSSLLKIVMNFRRLRVKSLSCRCVFQARWNTKLLRFSKFLKYL